MRLPALYRGWHGACHLLLESFIPSLKENCHEIRIADAAKPFRCLPADLRAGRWLHAGIAGNPRGRQPCASGDDDLGQLIREVSGARFAGLR